eukprot:TRINITY_DN1335_c1_g1_i1.p1 TRINITY_DN1335_c1_g1~~TRINITY_DN1335_c1_g1_i1.p1  ORF type:complete len:320 (+),score=45.86 TRINITY_DN1335_c1_g1_i1:122-1081(+)
MGAVRGGTLFAIALGGWSVAAEARGSHGQRPPGAGGCFALKGQARNALYDLRTTRGEGGKEGALVCDSTGPEHELQWTCEARLGVERVTGGAFKRKKDAMDAAAVRLLTKRGYCPTGDTAGTVPPRMPRSSSASGSWGAEPHLGSPRAGGAARCGQGSHYSDYASSECSSSVLRSEPDSDEGSALRTAVGYAQAPAMAAGGYAVANSYHRNGLVRRAIDIAKLYTRQRWARAAGGRPAGGEQSSLGAEAAIIGVAAVLSLVATAGGDGEGAAADVTLEDTLRQAKQEWYERRAGCASRIAALSGEQPPQQQQQEAEAGE